MFRKMGIFILALLLFSGCANAAGYDGRAEDGELKSYIRELCETYGVPEALAFAVIEKESSWNADAVNYNETCFGLMQINIINFPWLEEELGLDNPKDPYQNVQAGIYMLSGYIEKYIDYHMALMCYNCGESGARQLWQEGTFTSAYSRWVVDRMNELEWEALDAARDALAAQCQQAQVAASEDNVSDTAHEETPEAGETASAALTLTAEQVLNFGEPFPDAAVVLSSEGAVSTAYTFYAEDVISKNIGYAGAPGICAVQSISRSDIAARCRTLFRQIFCEQAARYLAVWVYR